MESIVCSSLLLLTMASTSIAVTAGSRAAFAQERLDNTSQPAATAGSVVSRDGTKIAYERLGKGPALVLVAPALADRSGSAHFAALLASRFTVINYDRRGRGQSGDTLPYTVQREIEDIEALIAAAGGSAFLFGSSSGAALALEAANALGAKVVAQVLFEPPFIVDDSRPPIPDGFFAEVGALVSANRRGDAVALFMTKGIGVPEDMVAGMRQAPTWAAMETRAHTLPYDGAVLAGLQGGKPLPEGRWTLVSARTLVLDGDQSPPFLRNSAQALTHVLPGSERYTLEGQDHSAVFTAPQALVPVLVEFLGSPAGSPDSARAVDATKDR